MKYLFLFLIILMSTIPPVIYASEWRQDAEIKFDGTATTETFSVFKKSSISGTVYEYVTVTRYRRVPDGTEEVCVSETRGNPPRTTTTCRTQTVYRSEYYEERELQGREGTTGYKTVTYDIDLEIEDADFEMEEDTIKASVNENGKLLLSSKKKLANYKFVERVCKVEGRTSEYRDDMDHVEVKKRCTIKFKPYPPNYLVNPNSVELSNFQYKKDKSDNNKRKIIFDIKGFPENATKVEIDSQELKFLKIHPTEHTIFEWDSDSEYRSRLVTFEKRDESVVGSFTTNLKSTFNRLRYWKKRFYYTLSLEIHYEGRWLGHKYPTKMTKKIVKKSRFYVWSLSRMYTKNSKKK